MAVNFYRMQVQPDVAGNLQNPVTGCVRITMPKRRSPDLRLGKLLGNILPDLAAFDVCHDLGYIWNFGLVGQNKNLLKFSVIERGAKTLHPKKRSGLTPLSLFKKKFFALINDDLTIGADL